MSVPPALSLQLDDAIAELVASELASAERPDAQTNLGSLFARRQQWQDAEAAFERALAIDPAWIPAYINLAEVQRAQGREDRAEAVLRRAIAANGEAAEPHHALGLSLVRQRRYDDALPALETAWRQASDNARFGYVYAVALDSLGHGPQAIAVLEDVVDHHPAHRAALMTLVQWHRDAGDMVSARDILGRLQTYAPNDPQIRALAETFPDVLRR